MKAMFKCEQMTDRALQDLCSVCGQMERQTPVCLKSCGGPCQKSASSAAALISPPQQGYEMTSTQPTSDAASEIILNPPESLAVDPSCAPTAKYRDENSTHPLPPGPPASKTDMGRIPEFDEFRTDVNENTLIVRVAKNSRRVCRIGGAAAVADDTEKQDLTTEKTGELARNLNEMPLCDGTCGQKLGAMPQLRCRQPSPKRYAMTCTDDGNDVSFLHNLFADSS